MLHRDLKQVRIALKCIPARHPIDREVRRNAKILYFKARRTARADAAAKGNVEISSRGELFRLP
jgi:hypothetical protein